jgi:hypothetical protein
MSYAVTADELAKRLWVLLSEVSDKEAINQAVWFFKDLDKN